MTLDTAHSKEIYQGNGNTTEFPFFFKVWDAAQIAVTVTDAAGSSVDVTTQCAIALNDGGGSVGYLHAGAPLPVGATLAITRNMPFTQGVDLVSASRFDPQVIEDALDQATAERQQTLEMMQRAVILPATSAETPQDVVRAVYAARDDAQTANSEAQAAMNTAANSATAAAASAAGAAGDADLARRWASEAEDVPVQAGEFSARHYSEKAKEAVPENLVGRVETLEGRTAPATTTSRGISRVATLADMEPGAVVENGPAVLAAGDIMSVRFIVGEFYYFRHPTLKPGFAPLQGGLISGAYQGKNITEYPIWDYLQTAEGQLLCKTEAEWQAMTQTAGYAGIGGAPFYVLDLGAGTLRMPDMRGMGVEAAGADSLGVGDVRVPGLPDVQGVASFGAALYVNATATGAFKLLNGTQNTYLASTVGGNANWESLQFKAGLSNEYYGRSNTVATRRWVGLACCYLGLVADA